MDVKPLESVNQSVMVGNTAFYPYRDASPRGCFTIDIIVGGGGGGGGGGDVESIIENVRRAPEAESPNLSPCTRSF